jgi:hypothetical protein
MLMRGKGPPLHSSSSSLPRVQRSGTLSKLRSGSPAP